MSRQRVTSERRGNARRLRRDSTEAEQALWRLLRARQLAHVKFRRQVPIGPWIVDFVAFEHKLVVEADGGQHADNASDIRRDAELNHRGFRILRFWNNDVLVNPEGVLTTIVDALRP